MITNATPAGASPVVPDLHDIKPPMDIPSGLAWLWWTLGLLAAVIVVYMVWRWWRKRAEMVPVIPPIPAHIRARNKLEHALALITEPKPFCVEVSDITRLYLEERFNFHAPERTTEEFLRELAGTNLLLKDQKESLGRFLESCDLVKFARYEPGENELRALHESALRLVFETQPRSEAEDQATAQPTTASA